jgi:predicted SAM-dependent methyltransferase
MKINLSCSHLLEHVHVKEREIFIGLSNSLAAISNRLSLAVPDSFFVVYSCFLTEVVGKLSSKLLQFPIDIDEMMVDGDEISFEEAITRRSNMNSAFLWPC